MSKPTTAKSGLIRSLAAAALEVAVGVIITRETS